MPSYIVKDEWSGEDRDFVAKNDTEALTEVESFVEDLLEGDDDYGSLDVHLYKEIEVSIDVQKSFEVGVSLK